MKATMRRIDWRAGTLKALWGSIILLAGCAGTPQPPQAITLAGIVVDGERMAASGESGLVGIERNGLVLEGRAGTVLQTGDQVATAANAYALIRYPSGTEVFLRNNTRGRVGSFTAMVGEVFAKIRGLFAIQTDFVEAGAEGTAYSVRADASGEYAVVVLEGTVRLSSLAQAWPAVRLGPAMAAAGRPRVPPRPMAATPEELQRSRAWVQRMEQLLAAPRPYSAVDAAILAGNRGGWGGMGAPADSASGDDAKKPARLSAGRAWTR